MSSTHKPTRSMLLRMAALAIISGASACSYAFGPKQVTWRCEAPNGRYVQNPQAISSATKVLSGQIQFNEAKFGEQWDPIAHVAFTDSTLSTAGNGDCFCNGIRASIYPAEPDTVKFFMIYNGQAEGIAQGPVGTPITFRMSIDEGGMLTVTIGKTNPVSKTAQLIHAERDTMQLSCSSGNVSVLDVKAE